MKYSVLILFLSFCLTSCIATRAKKDRYQILFQIAQENVDGDDIWNNIRVTYEGQLFFKEKMLYEPASHIFPIFEVFDKDYIVITEFENKHIEGRSDIYMFGKREIYLINSVTGAMYHTDITLTRMIKVKETKMEVIGYNFAIKEKWCSDLFLIEN